MKTQTFPGVLDSLTPVRDFVKASALEAGLSEPSVYKLILAVDELVTNSIKYGYADNNISGDIVVAVDCDGDEFVVTLEDTAPPFDPRESSLPTKDDMAAPLDERDIGGLGIFLAMSEVDRFDYRRTGTSNVSELAMQIE